MGIRRIDTEELRPARALALEAAGAPDACCASSSRPGREGAGSPTALAMVSTLPERLDELRARGIKLVALQLGLDAELRASAPWLLGGVKSTSYAVNMAAEAEAKRRGADDAVFLGSRRHRPRRAGDERLVARRRRLYTPALELGILAGVTRATLLEEAGAAAGYEVREGVFPLDHVAAATRRSRPPRSAR